MRPTLSGRDEIAAGGLHSPQPQRLLLATGDEQIAGPLLGLIRLATQLTHNADGQGQDR